MTPPPLRVKLLTIGWHFMDGRIPLKGWTSMRTAMIERKTRETEIMVSLDLDGTGDYDVELLYACPATDVGSTVELAFRGAKLTGKIAPAWDPPFHRPYTIPRPAPELLPKEFRPLHLGTLRLEKGRGPLTLRAQSMPGASVMELRQVTLTLR